MLNCISQRILGRKVKNMISVLECLRETWLNDLLIGLVIYTALSLCLIIILLVIIFKILNKNKEAINQQVKGGIQQNEKSR